MKKVLSFCLWGNKPIYTIGAVKNAQLAPTFYPDFEYWFYIHTPSVPAEIVSSLESLPGVKIIRREGDLQSCKPMTWRFEPIDDPEVEIMISRDTDTRILLREKLAVDEWLQSGKTFHIMRDHPHHCDPNMRILGGMFGTKKIPGFSWIETLKELIQTNPRDYDMIFLHKYVYPLIREDALVHSSFQLYPDETSARFPIPYDAEYNFVGEYVFPDDSRSQRHKQDLLNGLKKDSSTTVQVSNKIHLVTSFFVSKLERPDISLRNDELVEALQKNVDSPYIEAVHLFVDDDASMEKLRTQFQSQLDTGKIVVAASGKGMALYKDFFEYALTDLQGKLCMVSNSDIYIHSCDETLLRALGNSLMFALTRHEHDLTCRLINDYHGSHDSFLFKSPLNISLDGFDFPQNIWGSEHKLVSLLYKQGVRILNPCKQIQIVHLHRSEIREPDRPRIAWHSRNDPSVHFPPITLTIKNSV